MSMLELQIGGKSVALARMVLRERRPPPPRISLDVKPQYLRWEIGHYKDRLSFGPGGRGRARRWIPDRVSEQHNLVLDNAYELTARYGFLALNNYAAVGTGTTAPTTSDKTLAAEVARTNAVPAGEQDALTRVSDGVYDQQRVREFSATQVGGRNLGEWGFSPESVSGSQLAVKELFRDGSGQPVVLTLDQDQSLRLIYTIRIQLAPVTAQTVSIALTNLGTLTGKFLLTLGNPSYEKDDIHFIDEFARGYSTIYNYAILHDIALSTSYDDSQYQNWKARVNYTLQDYVAGSRQRRTDTIVFDQSIIGDFLTFGLGWYYGTNNLKNQAPARVVLDSALTKDNLHKLIFDPWTLAW